jgi:hypothetical protein
VQQQRLVACGAGAEPRGFIGHGDAIGVLEDRLAPRDGRHRPDRIVDGRERGGEISDPGAAPRRPQINAQIGQVERTKTVQRTQRSRIARIERRAAQAGPNLLGA